MTFWEAVTGKLAKYRRTCGDISTRFYCQLKSLTEDLNARYRDQPDYVAGIRHSLAALFQSVEAHTNESNLNSGVIAPFRERVLSFSQYDCSAFHAAFQAEHFIFRIDPRAPAAAKSALFRDFFDSIQTVYDVGVDYRLFWEKTLQADTIEAENMATLLAVMKLQKLKPILGLGELGPEMVLKWNLFSKAINQTAQQLCSKSSFEQDIQELISLSEQMRAIQGSK